MGDPATLVESTTAAASSPVVTAIPTVIAGEVQDGAKPASANKNGKKADSGSSGGSGFFVWFIVLALLGVWTSVAVVYFDLVDYQGVLNKAKGLQINLSEALQGKLVAYDTDGDGDFDVEDAKVLLDEAPAAARRGARKDPLPTRDVGSKLREALKQQLAVIHERVEAKKIAKMALAEVRQLLLKEEEEKELELGRQEITARVKERVAARMKEEEEKIEKEEMEKAVEKLRKEKAKQQTSEKVEEGKDEEERKHRREEKPEKKEEGEGKKEEDKGRGGKERRKKADRGGKK